MFKHKSFKVDDFDGIVDSVCTTFGVIIILALAFIAFILIFL